MSEPAHTAAAPSLAAVLVTDLVGSTELRARLGDARADAVRRAHDRLLRALVTRHRGRFVQWRGDGILAAFGSATAAARAAIAIQQANERENRRPRRMAQLAIRVGLSAGEVRVHGESCEGPPIAQAIAACESAEGGEILATELAVELVGSRETLHTRPVPDGRRRIEWQPIASDARRFDVPPGLRTQGELPFVGRERALRVLRDALEASRAGQSQLVVVQGEAGSGKTRLIAEFAHEAVARGVRVLYGPTHEDLSIPYEPIARALRTWMEECEDLSVRLGPRAGELVRIVPELGEWAPDLPPPTESDAETEQSLFYDALGEWLLTISLDDPVLLLLDSMHWASPPTFDLLRHIFRALGGSRVALVTTHRPSDPRAAELVRWAESSGGIDRVRAVELGGLGAAEIEDLLRYGMDSPPATALAGAIHLVTGGNPLHLGVLLRGDTAAFARTDDLPTSVREALRALVARLEPPVLRVLEAASVLGEDFDAAMLGLLFEDAEATDHALELAERRGLLREVDRRALRYQFSHALARETIYDGIGAIRAARLHERIGLLIEQREGPDGPHLVELARHFSAAVALGHRDRAARYAAGAAHRALAQYANQQAAELFEEALRLLGDGGEMQLRCDLAIGQGEAMRRAGMPGYREVLDEAATLAQRLGDGERMGRALLAAYRGTFSRGVLGIDPARRSRFAAALEHVGSADPPLRARLLAMLAVESAFTEDARETRQQIDEAVALARGSGDEALLGEILAQRQWVVFHPMQERLAATEELAALAARSANPLLRFDSLGSEAFTRIRAGDRPGFDRAMTSLRLLASEIEQPLVRWMFLIREATAALMECRLAEAEELIEEGRQLSQRTGQLDTHEQYAVQRFWLDFELEDATAARRRIEPLARGFDQIPRLSWSAVAYRCCDLDRLDLARPIVARILEGGIDRLPPDQVWLWTLCQLGEMTARLGDQAGARTLLELLEPCAGLHANMVFGTLGAVSRYVGLLQRALGDAEGALLSLRAAEAGNAEMKAPSWLARTRLDLAELRFEHHGRSDPEAQEKLRRAADAAFKLSLASVRERVVRISRAHGTP